MHVSIIIPVYNAEKYLKECLDSAINQTYQNIEVIAVYDGYPDKSPEILKTYSDKIKILNKESGRVGAALNAGIRVAKGEWIKRLDVDDVLFPDAIENLLSQANKVDDKQNTILCGDYDVIDNQGKLIDERKDSKFNNLTPFDFNVMLLDHHTGLASSSLVHNSTLKKYGMFNEEKNFEDYELWLRYCILHNCRIQFVAKKITKYRVHPGNISKEKAKKTLEDTDKLRNTILSQLDFDQKIKYENALKIYKKNKSISGKGKDFVRNRLFKILPTSISSSLTDAYWYSRKLKK